MILPKKILCFLIMMNCHKLNASELMEPRLYIADTAKVVTKGKWLGLANTNNSWSLVNVSPTFKKNDIPGSRFEGSIDVSVEAPEVVFLLMDESLTAGPIQSSWEAWNQMNEGIWRENSSLPEIGKMKSIGLNKSIYELHNTSNEIFIKFDGKSQRLFDYTYQESREVNSSIQWIGDLDRDKKLDLILYEAFSNCDGELHLYLSGKSETGSLVKLVASRKTYYLC